MRKNLVVIKKYNSDSCTMELLIHSDSLAECECSVKCSYDYISASVNSKALTSTLKSALNDYFNNVSFIGILEELALSKANKKAVQFYL